CGAVNAALKASRLRRFWSFQKAVGVVPRRAVFAVAMQAGGVSLAGNAGVATITSRPKKAADNGEKRHESNIPNAAFAFAAWRHGPGPRAGGIRSGSRRRPNQDRRYRGGASYRR